MKSTTVWVIAAILSFIVLVLVIFLVLYNQNPDDPTMENEAILSDKFIADTYLEQKDQQIDSLKTLIDSLRSTIFFDKLEYDSVNQVLAYQQGLISEYKSSLEKASSQLNQKAQTSAKLQELAKTYESMKIADMQPILAELDDKTVLDLYKYTGARNRKNLLKALSSKRAAAITEVMAKGER